jgi:hypothetical protein
MKTCAARLQAIRVQDWTQDSGIRGMFLGLFFGFRGYAETNFRQRTPNLTA